MIPRFRRENISHNLRRVSIISVESGNLAYHDVATSEKKGRQSEAMAGMSASKRQGAVTNDGIFAWLKDVDMSTL